MHRFHRLVRSYTCFNLLLLAVARACPPLQGVSRASSVLVAVIVTYLLSFVSINTLHMYYRTLWPSATPLAMTLLHITLHYGVLTLTGLRITTSETGAALLVLGTWYTVFRSQLPDIYIPELAVADYDRLVAHSMLLTLVAASSLDQFRSQSGGL